MNKCHFLGRAQRLYFREASGDGAECIQFELEVEEFRKEKNGNKVRELNYFEMEAWGTAAKALSSYLDEDGLLAVEAIARNDGEGTFFRITSFKILRSDNQ